MIQLLKISHTAGSLYFRTILIKTIAYRVRWLLEWRKRVTTEEPYEGIQCWSWKHNHEGRIWGLRLSSKNSDFFFQTQVLKELFDLICATCFFCLARFAWLVSVTFTSARNVGVCLKYKGLSKLNYEIPDCEPLKENNCHVPSLPCRARIELSLFHSSAQVNNLGSHNCCSN